MFAEVLKLSFKFCFLPLKSKCPQRCRDHSVGKKNCLVHCLLRFSVGGDARGGPLSAQANLKAQKEHRKADQGVTFKYPANPSLANGEQGGDGHPLGALSVRG